MRLKKTTADYMAEFTPDEREEILQEKNVLLTQMRLEEIRKKRHVTQKSLAEKMDVSQPRVSKAENGLDPRISTINQYAVALGGRLKVEIEFPDGVVEPVFGSFHS